MSILKKIWHKLPIACREEIKIVLGYIAKFVVSIYGFFKFEIALRRTTQLDICLIGTPQHGNLGDHAIAIASDFLLNGHIQYKRVFEIPTDMYFYYRLCLKKHLSEKCIIVINGGGSMGIEWFSFEELIRSAIRTFKKNRVIILPQTIYYGNSTFGKKEFENSKKIYSFHPDLHICARESCSYKVMKDAYPQNDVLLVPDMVLLLNECKFQNERKGILLCLRNDVERVISSEQMQEIKQYCQKFTDRIAMTDTVIREQVPIEERSMRLTEKWEEFSTAELVITDRLHGMVFCAITGTPCIALSNYNHKVKGVYEWIKDLEYIQYLDDYREIPAHIPRLIAMKDCKYSAEQLRPYFAQIEALLVNGKRTGECG